jgi:hypothetical protein
MRAQRNLIQLVWLARRALRRLGSEDGIAIPVTLGVLALTILVAGVAHSQSNDATSAASADRSTKRAIQAADAGLQAASYHMNLLDVTQNGDKCVNADSNGKLHRIALGTSQEWCGAVEGSLADGASYSYRVSRETCYSGQTPVNCSSTHTRRARTVVSTGTVGSVKRRVASTVEGYTAQPLFSQPWAVFSDQNLSMDSNAIIDGNAGSNGNISLNSSAKVCDTDGSGNTANATPGPGKSVTPAGANVCGSKAPALAPWVPAPVQANNFADEDNDNETICPTGCPSDVNWNPTTHRLTLDSNSSITLTGSVYSFCYLRLNSNSKLVIPAGNTVTIYIEPPSRCTALPSSERGNVEFLSNSSILNQNTSPNTLQFYVSGSSTTTTTVRFDSNFQQSGSAAWPFMVYAPLSNVSLLSNTRIQGAVVGKTVIMDSNAVVRWDPAIMDVTTGAVFPLLRHTAYRECSSAPPANGAPADGC